MTDKLVVLQTRVPLEVANKVKATAAARGMTESQVLRLWIQETAATITPESFEESLEQELQRERETRLRKIADSLAGQG